MVVSSSDVYDTKLVEQHFVNKREWSKYYSCVVTEESHETAYGLVK
jgi:hypothetical protein